MSISISIGISINIIRGVIKRLITLRLGGRRKKGKNGKTKNSGEISMFSLERVKTENEA